MAILFIFVSFGIGTSVLLNRKKIKDEKLDSLHKVHLDLLRNNLDKALSENENFPEEFELGQTRFKIKYTFNQKLTNYIKKLIRRYRPDFSSVVVIDNQNGHILSAIGHERKKDRFNKNLVFSSTHPSASLFKIITAAELLQNSHIESDSMFSFAGRSNTLYRYQLQRTGRHKWNRYQSLAKAFALSNNVVFGKAAINNLTGNGIYEMAQDFGFNQCLMKELTLDESFLEVPHNQYHLAEIASGFNRSTLISPVHAALLSSIVANEGVMRYPTFISQIIKKQLDGVRKNLWKNITNSKRVFDKKISWDMKKMMEMTVKKGTARSIFRRMKKNVKRAITIGGKTGTITGGKPYGKRDWFTAYAMPKDGDLGSGISVSVMNVNLEKWYVKSTYIAQKIIEYYFDNIRPITK